jgi:hypothetical protein
LCSKGYVFDKYIPLSSRLGTYNKRVSGGGCRCRGR